MKTLILFAFLGPPAAHALELTAPVCVASKAEKATLEKFVGDEITHFDSNDKTKVKCHSVFTVATGGTMNTATVGLCVLDGQEYELASVNNMMGSGKSSLRLHPEFTEKYELLTLIANECSGLN